MPHPHVVVSLAGVLTCLIGRTVEAPGQDYSRASQREEHITIAYRPMRIDTSAAMQRVTRSGQASVRLQVDTSGRVVPGSERIQTADDTLLGALATEIVRQMVWDSETVRRVVGREVVVPFAFMVSIGAEPALFEFGKSHVATNVVAYAISRADSTSPARGEAVVVIPKRVSGPPPWYPRALQVAQIGGSVMVEAIVDTLGRVEQGSVKIVSSSEHGFDQSAQQVVERSVFQVTRTPWRALRVRVHIPITYAIKY
jgi:TonB family protein